MSIHLSFRALAKNHEWKCFLLLVFLFPLCLNAQEEKQDTVEQERKKLIEVTDEIATAVRHTGRKIKKQAQKLNDIDTLYISPNLYNLAFMLEHSTWYEHYRLGNNADSQTDKKSLNFSPSLGTKFGIYFGWRWIFLGYTFDIEDLFGGNKNKLINV